MRVLQLSAAALLAAFLFLPSPTQAQPAAVNAVWVAYRCNTKGDRCLKGTAFHVGAGVFYTNAHVARPVEGLGPLLLARGQHGRDLLGEAKVLCINDRASRGEDATPFDIAKIHVAGAKADKLPALRFSRWGPLEGMRVTVIGYPGGAWTAVVAEGTITDLLPDQVFALEVRSGAVTRGSSGSPVLNPAGDVVGMVYAEEVSGLRFATAVNWVLNTTCR